MILEPCGALPPYFGGKRRLLRWIFSKLGQIIPPTDWHQRIFVDAFAGGCSVSLYAKLMGFQAVHSNDWSARTQIIFQALLTNQTQRLSKEDLLWLTQPLPEAVIPFVTHNLVPHVFSTRHADALDRIFYWANQYHDATKRHLGLLLLWHLVHEYVCMPTSINTSNRPYAETLDGLRDYQQLNPKRFTDKSFPRLLKPRWSKLETLRHRINAGVTGGSPFIPHQQDACEFLANTTGDIAYFDPPYPGTLSYESTMKTLDSVLLGREITDGHATSSFTKDVSALGPLLEGARHIPVWILSYANNVIDLPSLTALVQDLAPSRTVCGYDRPYRHLAHVSKAQDRRELLVIAYEKELLPCNISI